MGASQVSEPDITVWVGQGIEMKKIFMSLPYQVCAQ